MIRAVLLAGCCLLALAIEVRAVTQSPVPAADAVRYVRLAQRIDAEGWTAVARTGDEHLLFPWLVAKTHRHVTTQFVAPRLAWVTAAQATAGLLAALTVIPAYFCFRGLVSEPAVLPATALFSAWPALGRLGADGLADSTQLLAVTTAVACLLGSRNPALFAIAGLCLGVASLARAEAWLIAAALVAVALGAAAVASWSRTSESTARPFKAAQGFALGLCIAPGLFLGQVQPVSTTDAVTRLLGRPRSGISLTTATSTAAVVSANPLDLPAKDHSRSSRFQGVIPALGELAAEAGDTSDYWLLLLACFGGWSLARPKRDETGTDDHLRRKNRHAVAWIGGIYLLLLVIVTSRLGYLSERQLLPVSVLLFPWASHGLLALLDFAQERFFSTWTNPVCRRRVTLGVVGSLTIAMTVAAAAPRHTSRAAHRSAAEWLARQPQFLGCVFDTRGWTGHYSGHKTITGDQARNALNDPRLAYVVVEDRELQGDNPRSRQLVALLGQRAVPVAEFSPIPRASLDTAVLVFRWVPERKSPALVSATLTHP